MKNTVRLTNIVDECVGMNVTLNRTELGLSAGDVAETLAIPLHEYHQYEAGAKRFGAALLLQLSAVMGVDPSDFFEGTEMIGALG